MSSDVSDGNLDWMIEFSTMMREKAFALYSLYEDKEVNGAKLLRSWAEAWENGKDQAEIDAILLDIMALYDYDDKKIANDIEKGMKSLYRFS